MASNERKVLKEKLEKVFKGHSLEDIRISISAALRDIEKDCYYNPNISSNLSTSTDVSIKESPEEK